MMILKGKYSKQGMKSLLPGDEVHDA
jgi:hypothetical protein